MTAPSSDGVDVTIHHLVAGPAATTLLISHATGFHGRAYEPVAAALGDVSDVWALDHRGHGLTAAPPGWVVSWHGYHDDAEAAALWLSRRSAGQPGTIVGFGHSMGGATLLMTAHRHPRLFAALVLFEPIVLPSTPELSDIPNPLQIGARRRRPWFPSFDAAIANFASKPPMSAFDPAALDAYVRGGLAPVDPGDPEGPVRLLCEPDLEADTFAASFGHDTWEHLASTETPTLVLAGTADDSSGPALAAPLIAEQLPNGRYEAHSELDHFGPFTHPEAVAQIVRRTLLTP